jgi:hypothetical protein
MAKFLDYNSEQAYLLPPSVRDVLGREHLCFFYPAGGDQTDSGGLPERVQRGRRTAVCAGNVGFGLAVCLRVERDEFAAARATDSG